MATRLSFTEYKRAKGWVFPFLGLPHLPWEFPTFRVKHRPYDWSWDGI